MLQHVLTSAQPGQLSVKQSPCCFYCYSVWCGACVCCLILLHVLSGPTEPPHQTSPITQSPPPPFHKGTSALPVSLSTPPNIYTCALPCKTMVHLSSLINDFNECFLNKVNFFWIYCLLKWSFVVLFYKSSQRWPFLSDIFTDFLYVVF